MRKSVSWVYKNASLLDARKLGGSLFFPAKEDLYERLFQKEQGMAVRFHLNGTRYTEAWFKTKTAAKHAEAEKRKELLNPEPTMSAQLLSIQTDMGFRELLNQRLDFVKAYNSERHYTDYRSLARRWAKRWGKLRCSQISPGMIQQFLIERLNGKSAFTANKEFGLSSSVIQFYKRPDSKMDAMQSNRRNSFFPDCRYSAMKTEPQPRSIYIQWKEQNVRQLIYLDHYFSESLTQSLTREKTGVTKDIVTH